MPDNIEQVKREKKFVKVAFTLTLEALEMLEKLYENGPFGSKSEVVRYCIMNNGIADYKLSRIKKGTAQEKIDSITTEQWCTDVLGGEVNENYKDQGKVCMLTNKINPATKLTIEWAFVKKRTPGDLPYMYRPDFVPPVAPVATPVSDKSANELADEMDRENQRMIEEMKK